MGTVNVFYREEGIVSRNGVQAGQRVGSGELDNGGSAGRVHDLPVLNAGGLSRPGSTEQPLIPPRWWVCRLDQPGARVSRPAFTQELARARLDHLGAAEAHLGGPEHDLSVSDVPVSGFHPPGGLSKQRASRAPIPQRHSQVKGIAFPALLRCDEPVPVGGELDLKQSPKPGREAPDSPAVPDVPEAQPVTRRVAHGQETTVRREGSRVPRKVPRGQ